MAESFVDTFKTELVADRVWRTRSQLELAIVEWVAWLNTERLHQRRNHQTQSPWNPARLSPHECSDGVTDVPLLVGQHVVDPEEIDWPELGHGKLFGGMSGPILLCALDD